jgi:hypothetical protein
MGFFLTKSRGALSNYNHGGHMISDVCSGRPVEGAWFELSLDDVERFVNE